MKKFFRLLQITLVCTLLIVPQFTNAYNYADADQIEGQYLAAIDWMVKNEVFRPDDVGVLAPKGCVNRAHMAALLVRIFNWDIVESGPNFPDIAEGMWYEDLVRTIKVRGIAQGYLDGNYGPSDCVLRAEAIKMVTLAFGLTDLPELDLDHGQVNGMTRSDWYYDYVDYALAANLVGLAHTDVEKSNYEFKPVKKADTDSGYKYELVNKRGVVDYKPHEPMLREEVAEFLYRIKVLIDAELDIYNTDYNSELIAVDPEYYYYERSGPSLIRGLEATKTEGYKSSLSDLAEVKLVECTIPTLRIKVDLPEVSDCKQDYYFDEDRNLYYKINATYYEIELFLESYINNPERYAGTWFADNLEVMELELASGKATVVNLPHSLLTYIMFQSGKQQFFVETNLYGWDFMDQMIESIEFIELEPELVADLRLVQANEDNLVSWPNDKLAEQRRLHKQNLADLGLMGARLVDNTEWPIWQEYEEMRNGLLIDDYLFAEQVRGIFYYQDQPEVLYAKVVNEPTHATDSRDPEFWNKHFVFGTEYTQEYKDSLQELTSGGLYRSIDGGENWDRIWEIDRIVSASACSSDPDKLYGFNTDHFGAGSLEAYLGLYVSEDGGKSWIKPELVYAESEWTADLREDEEVQIMWPGAGYQDFVTVSPNCDQLVLGTIPDSRIVITIDLNSGLLDFIDVRSLVLE